MHVSESVGVYMSTNSIEGNNYNKPVYRTSIVGSMITDTIMATGFGLSLPYIFGVDADSFSKQGAEILEKNTNLKDALKDHNIDGLFAAKKEKTIKKVLEGKPEVLKAFEELSSKVKGKMALKNAKLGVVLGATLGLIFGFIYRGAEKKAMRKAAQGQ